MLFWFLVGLAILVGVIWFARWYAGAPTQQARVAFKVFAAIAVGAVALLLLTRSGLPILLSILGALAPLALTLRGAFRRARAAQGPTPGGGSTVTSAWLEMRLDHETGEISGRVLQGEHADRDLDDLSEAELRDLAGAVMDDANSARLLAAYMARRFGDPEPEGYGAESPPASGGMSRAEALAILDLEEGAGREAINAAYKRLIAKAHPDRGGSAYLAAKINEARGVLLGET